MIETFPIKVTTTGSAGSAAGSADSAPINGILRAIRVDYHASAPATTDLTVTELNSLGRTLLTKTDTATDDIVYPTVEADDAAFAAITDTVWPICIDGRVRVSVAQSNALAPAVTVWVQVER